MAENAEDASYMASTVNVIALNKEGLSAGALQSVSVVPADAVLSGKAIETGSMHYESPNGKFLIGTWECTPYAEMLHYPETSEFCIVLSGRVALTNGDGTVHEFRAGDSFIVPKGFEGKFEVLEMLRKIYVLYND